MSKLVYTIDGQYLENDQVKLDLKTNCDSKYSELSIQQNTVQPSMTQEEKNPLEKFSNQECESNVPKTCEPKCKEDEYCDSFVYNNRTNFICRPKK